MSKLSKELAEQSLMIKQSNWWNYLPLATGGAGAVLGGLYLNKKRHDMEKKYGMPRSSTLGNALVGGTVGGALGGGAGMFATEAFGDPNIPVAAGDKPLTLSGLEALRNRISPLDRLWNGTGAVVGTGRFFNRATKNMFESGAKDPAKFMSAYQTPTLAPTSMNNWNDVMGTLKQWANLPNNSFTALGPDNLRAFMQSPGQYLDSDGLITAGRATYLRKALLKSFAATHKIPNWLAIRGAMRLGTVPGLGGASSKLLGKLNVPAAFRSNKDLIEAFQLNQGQALKDLLRGNHAHNKLKASMNPFRHGLKGYIQGLAAQEGLQALNYYMNRPAPKTTNK